MLGWRAIFCIGIVFCLDAPCQSEEHSPASSLVTKAQWVRFEVLAGRLAARQARFNRTRTLTKTDSSSGIHESISVSAKQHQTCFLYERICPAQTFRVDFLNGDTVEMRCSPRGSTASPHVYLRQADGVGIQLVVTNTNAEQRIHADSIWHLLLSYPELCERHLLPALERLRPDWRLMEAAESIKLELLRTAVSEPVTQQSHIAKLVDQLGSHHHPTRRAADRQLRSLGQQTIGYLRHVDRDMLNAEQRIRTQQILRSLKLPVADTPQRVAQRMIGDVQVWATLLESGDFDARCVAAAHLEHICGRALAVDVHGNPESRQTDVEQVRRQLGLMTK